MPQGVINFYFKLYNIVISVIVQLLLRLGSHRNSVVILMLLHCCSEFFNMFQVTATATTPPVTVVCSAA